MANEFNPLQFEPEILAFWERTRAHDKARKANKGGKPFYFLDGPPYTSGKVHLGTAWNKALKDSVLRYKRMRGLDVWDRAGYDMHGLPIEHAVEKELGLKNKDEIEKFGVEPFVKACESFATKNLLLMNKDFQRLGVWMDFENAYQSITNEFMEGEWWLIRQAHEKGRLYEGKRTMTWCARCASAVAKHELEYKQVSDNSIFVKFKVKGKSNEYLIIWTTTPWTIPFNLGIMVHPDFDYVKVQVVDEVWIVAKELASVIEKEAGKKFEIIKEMKGKALKGTGYIHPFAGFIPELKTLKKMHPNVHTVVLTEEYVSLEAGSGLVHMAPGCGPEDYEVGHRNDIPPFNSLSEDGTFPESMGKFAGLKAKKDDKEFVEALREAGALIASGRIDHDYAHCWRCKEPLIYRTTMQWFFRIEDLKEKMREANRNIYWVPEFAGSRNFDAWLENLRDNSITKQRYWGTALPIWRCEKCRDYSVVASAKELERLGGKIPKNLHKPWIDEVTIKCKCGGTKRRIPDVLDVWIDAGSTSWNSLDYPAKKALFEKLYPADFILEGIDQIRGWFNLLMVASMIAIEKPSFKAVYMHGFINDSLGRKMSKSLGNYILPEEVIGKYGADTLRYYMIGGASPGIDVNYNFEDMKVKYRNLILLWNLHNYLLNYADEKTGRAKSEYSAEEHYIISKMNSTIQKVTELFEEYRMNEVPWAIEELFLELSRMYVQITREKISSEEKGVVVHTLHEVLIATLKLFAPIAPFITEQIYQNLKAKFGLKEESIHHFPWPKADKEKINKKLEEDMALVFEVLQGAFAAREKAQRGIRWPLKELIIVTKDERTRKAAESLKDIIKKQLNVRNVAIDVKHKDIKPIVKANFAKIREQFGDDASAIIQELAKRAPDVILQHLEKGTTGVNANGKVHTLGREHFIIEKEIPKQYSHADIPGGVAMLNKELTPELEEEGYLREVIRRIQNLRKESGMKKEDKINLYIKAQTALKKTLAKYENEIMQKAGIKKIEVSESSPVKPYKNTAKDKIKAYEIEMWVERV